MNATLETQQKEAAAINIFDQNPYRVIGVLADCKPRELTMSLNRLSKSIDANIEITDDYSFAYLGHWSKRDSDNIEKAQAELSSEKSRIEHGSFWFINAYSSSDSVALKRLESGNIEQAISIWSGVIARHHGVDQRSFPSYQNLSNLLLWKSSSDFAVFKTALALKIDLLQSPYWKSLKDIIAGGHPELTQIQLQLIHLRTIRTIAYELNYNDLSYLSCLAELDFEAKEAYMKEYSVTFIDQLEEILTQYRNEGQAHINSSLELIDKLQNETRSNLNLLEMSAGCDSLQYMEIADKIALLIVAIGTDYHNKGGAQDKTSRIKLVNHLDKARHLARGAAAQQHCNHNFNLIQRPLVKNSIGAHISQLNSLTDDLNQSTNALSSTISFLKAAKPILSQISNTAGSSSPEYATASKYTAISAYNKIARSLNKEEKQPNYKEVAAFAMNALLVIAEIEQLYIDHELKATLKQATSDFTYIAKSAAMKELDQSAQKRQPKRHRSLFIIGVMFFAGLFIYNELMKESRDYQKIQGADTSLISCQVFLRKYPTSKYKNKLLSNQLKNIKSDGSIKQIYEFHLAFPKTSQGKKAFAISRNKSNKLYEKACDLSSIAEWRDFLETVPLNFCKNGSAMLKEAIAAEKRRKELAETEREERLWGSDSKAWETATALGAVSHFKKYLDKYPNGVWVEEAEKSIIDLEVDEALKGDYEAMPTMSKVGSSYGSTTTSIRVSNNTEYVLVIMYSGSASKKLVLQPHTTSSISLPNDTYRIVASVAVGSVRKYAGTKSMDGGSYTTSYYITTSYY